jgi:hypothetical protein
MRFAGIYGITVGILIFIQWMFFLATAQIPELETAPFELVFHLAAEFMTAMVMIASGAAILRGRPWAPRAYYLSSGMLVYAVVNSAGYFLQLRQWAFVMMFAALLFLTVFSVGKVVRAPGL